jgi:phosphoribosylformylglycinamidine synthase subunit PurL
LAESSIFALDEGRNLGSSVTLPGPGRQDLMLFGEEQSRIIISVRKQHLDDVMQIALKSGVECKQIGEVIHDNFRIGNAISVSVQVLAGWYNDALGKRVDS